MLKFISVNQSLSLMLAHSIKVNNKMLRKGRKILKEDIAILQEKGIKKIYVYDLSKQETGENEAASKVAKHIAGKNIYIQKAFNGRADLFAKINGMLNFNIDKLSKLNYQNNDIAVSMLKAEKVVKKNQLIGNIKILPYGIKKKYLQKILKKDKNYRFINIESPKLSSIILLISTDDTNLKQNKKIIESITLRLEIFNLKIKRVFYCKHSLDALKESIQLITRKNLDLVLVYSSTSIVDKNDIIPLSIKNLNGKIVSFGAPTDPGNLLLIGSLNNTNIIGVPGCAKSILRNGFDVILEKICYGITVNKKTIAEMSDGGLFKNSFKK